MVYQSSITYFLFMSVSLTLGIFTCTFLMHTFSLVFSVYSHIKIHINQIVLISYAVELLLYAPTRPVVDFSVIFLWAMAVGTIVTASLWQEFGTSEHTDERYSELSKVYYILFTIIVVL